LADKLVILESISFDFDRAAFRRIDPRAVAERIPCHLEFGTAVDHEIGVLDTVIFVHVSFLFGRSDVIETRHCGQGRQRPRYLCHLQQRVALAIRKADYDQSGPGGISEFLIGYAWKPREAGVTRRRATTTYPSTLPFHR
jgi:hypothetical protein